MKELSKRSRILAATQELIAQNGFHGTSTAMITTRAEVAPGTMYRYFENKDALINKAYKELEERLFQTIMSGYPMRQPIRARFVHIFKRFVSHSLASPKDFRFLEQFHNSPYGVEHRRDKVLAQNDTDIFCDLFDEARRQEVFKDLPNPILFALAFGPVIDVVRDHILGFIELNDTLIEKTINACWDALKIEKDPYFPKQSIVIDGQVARPTS